MDIRIDTRLAQQCQQFIATLPITNVALAQPALSELLKAMHREPPPPADYLSVLESARESLDFLQDAMAARYASKPFPSTPEENAAFDRTVALWKTMADSYARVAQLGGGDPAIQQQLALVCQRCIHYAGQSVIEHHRAHRAVGAGFWLELHGYFDTAEDWGFADTVVLEPLGENKGNVTCATSYGAVLLVDLANPYGRTPRELALVVRWARNLSLSTGIRKPEASAGSRGYGVDLMQDRGLLPVDRLPAKRSARLFDTSRLGDVVQRLLTELKTGRNPADIGLGECTKTQASRLLLQLYRPWCLAAMPRRFERSQASGTLAIAHDLDAIFFHIAGKAFSQPTHVRTFSRSEVDSMVTYGSMVESAKPISAQAAKLDHELDHWDIADQSPNGFRAFRSTNGPRVEHGQLVALKAPDAKHFVLGRVTWLKLEKEGRLQIGIQILPSPAAGVALRPTGLSIAASEKYTRGFFLPAVPAHKEPISVILPTGWYSPGRVIEVFTDRKVSVKLGEMMVQGTNFERCTFTLAH